MSKTTRFFVTLIFYLVFIITATIKISYADTLPIQIPFYVAYEDLEIVKKANLSKTMDNEIAQFLISKANSIDQKVAVINALGNNFNTLSNKTDNTERFLELALGKKLNLIKMNELTPEDCFCIGYMLAIEMNDLQKAIEYIDFALKNKSDSLTMNLISALVYQQKENWVEKSVWYKKYYDIEIKMYRNLIQFDMRIEAGKTICDYMSHDEYNIFKLKTSPVFSTLKCGEVKFLKIDGGIPGFKVESTNEVAEAYVVGDSLFVKAKKPGIEKITIKDVNGVSDIINISVLDEKNLLSSVSKSKQEGYNTFARKKEILFSLVSAYFSVDGNLMEIDTGRYTKPVIVNGRTLIPIRALIEVLGGNVKWDGSQEMINITLNSNLIKLWINKDKGKLNDTEFSMDVAPQVINQRTMVPLRFISEKLGYSVKWNADDSSVKILKNDFKIDYPSEWQIKEEVANTFNYVEFYDPFGNQFKVTDINLEFQKYTIEQVKDMVINAHQKQGNIYDESSGEKEINGYKATQLFFTTDLRNVEYNFVSQNKNFWIISSNVLKDNYEEILLDGKVFFNSFKVDYVDNEIGPIIKNISQKNDFESNNLSTNNGNNNLNLLVGGAFAEDNEWEYFDKSSYSLDTSAVFKKNKLDGKISQILDSGAKYINTYKGRLIYTSRDEDSKYSIYTNLNSYSLDLSKSDIKPILLEENVGYQVVYKDKIYYVKQNGKHSGADNPFYEGEIWCMDIDGSNKKKLSTNGISSFSIDGDWIYYILDNESFSTNQYIYRINIEGGSPTRIFTPSDMSIRTFIVENEIIYFNESHKGLKRYNISKNTTDTIIEGYIFSFNVNKQKVLVNINYAGDLFLIDLKSNKKDKIIGPQEQNFKIYAYGDSFLIYQGEKLYTLDFNSKSLILYDIKFDLPSFYEIQDNKFNENLLKPITKIENNDVSNSTTNIIKYLDKAKKLYSIGIFTEIPQNDFEQSLGNLIDRQTCVVMLEQLFGLWQEVNELSDADTEKITSSLRDVSLISNKYLKGIAYALNSEITRKYPDNTFGPTKSTKGLDLCALVLKQLGYEDFIYEKAGTKFADLTGVNNTDKDMFDTSAPITKDVFVNVAYNALMTKFNKSDKTLIERLVSKGIVTKEKAIAAGLM